MNECDYVELCESYDMLCDWIDEYKEKVNELIDAVIDLDDLIGDRIKKAVKLAKELKAGTND